MPSRNVARRDRPRHWALDFASSAAFAVLAFYLARSLKVVPLAALFAFVVCGGLAWLFGKNGLRNLFSVS
ncbi:MAG: hypothetical protein ACKO5K_16210 [Armatimonadota bacterium]